MKKLSRILITGLATAGTAAAMGLAPVAAAAVAGQPDCTVSAPGNSLCESAGNAQIVAAPTDVPCPAWDTYGYGPAFVGGEHHLHHIR
ncbi:hypothetical protein HZU38_19380 [Mycolicibacterium vanbaalenii]|jgi:hypothetical protein|uniref:hypothetical protein n=1 Tax=Mycolicibacterium vanbaalenii TaxID=110539 RepID=UPI001F16F083|nr:hypothetical protein [Mycolicibacterium vanbaalenii]UJL27095.1 hypothetical protein HZU38_19380 [Mycolicibacterium vanbaalenii]WND59219.1 hypothetical protein QQA43_12995 [Mycolicibacterium vanbaalenii]